MNEENEILTIENLNVHYGDLQALFNVALKINRGSIVSIIGSNGSGKSTLLNTITGVNKPTSGKVTFEGHDITSMMANKIIARGISVSPEGSRVFESLTVRENLMVGAYVRHARKHSEQSLEKVYKLFPALKEKERELANFLSGGQRQMLAIGCALMSRPRLILCDEISLGLAPIVVKDIYNKIQEINKNDGTAFILVEQDVKRSLKYADYSYVMVKGKIVMEGLSAELPEEEVKGAYFGLNKYVL
jgi:branched-chain amino acid transport system ATP-binding protein